LPLSGRLRQPDGDVEERHGGVEHGALHHHDYERSTRTRAATHLGDILPHGALVSYQLLDNHAGRRDLGDGGDQVPG
jgi:hypothetical protein